MQILFKSCPWQTVHMMSACWRAIQQIMRSATQDPDWSHKAFNTSGSLVFWNDLFDPSKTFLSSFDTTSNVLLILFMEMFMKLLNNKRNVNRRLQNWMQRSWTMSGMLALWMEGQEESRLANSHIPMALHVGHLVDRRSSGFADFW